MLSAGVYLMRSVDSRLCYGCSCARLTLFVSASVISADCWLLWRCVGWQNNPKLEHFGNDSTVNEYFPSMQSVFSVVVKVGYGVPSVVWQQAYYREATTMYLRLVLMRSVVI